MANEEVKSAKQELQEQELQEVNGGIVIRKDEIAAVVAGVHVPQLVVEDCGSVNLGAVK